MQRVPPRLIIEGGEVGAVNERSQHLEAWVEQGLISAEQAVAIRDYEERTQEPGRPLLSHGRVPLVTEALGYLGIGVAAAALVILLAEDWTTFPLGTRLAATGIGTVVLLLAGWLLRSNDEPAFARFGSVLWALAVASAAWFTGILMVDGVEADEVDVAFTIGAVATLVGATLYAMRREVLQLIVLAAGSATLVIGLVQLPLDKGEAAAVQVGIALWVLAIVWLALTYRGVLIPRALAYGLGAFAALMGPDAVATGNGEPIGGGLLLGLVTAFALIAASVWLRENVLLVFGSIGAFGYLLGTLKHFFGDTMGMPLVLLTTGAILLVVAFLTMRLRRTPGAHAARHHPPTAHPV